MADDYGAGFELERLKTSVHAKRCKGKPRLFDATQHAALGLLGQLTGRLDSTALAQHNS